MRLRSFALACAVAVSSLALSATGASAFFHSGPGGCRVTIHSPVRITAGESATVFGQLVCRHNVKTEGKIVRLFRRVPGVPGSTLEASTTTGAGGAYQFQLTGSVVENNGIWHVRSRGAESVNRSIRVAPQVTFEGPPEGTQILTGVANKVTFTGKVTPADIGARVVLQRQNALTGNEWHRIDLGVVEAGGGYSIPHTFIVPGDANLRVLVLSQGRNVRETSSPLTYEISQEQNKELTIEATPDPILYGQSVVLSGTLAGVTSSQPVTLLARNVHQHGFAPVAQVNTSSSGAYTFPAQTPVNSTYYKVQGDGKISAVLFEGVKYVLTAEASATSLMEGQVVTFSGNVAPTPAQPGHVIYLQRENASGTGFHVVRVGTGHTGSHVLDPLPGVQRGGRRLPRVHPRRSRQRGHRQPDVHDQREPGSGRGFERSPGQLFKPLGRIDQLQRSGKGRRRTGQRRRGSNRKRRSSPRASPPPVATQHASILVTASIVVHRAGIVVHRQHPGTPPASWSHRGRLRAASVVTRGYRPRVQMGAHLALDPLQGVVHGLGVAGEVLAHLLVGAAIQIQRQHAALQLRERR